MTRGLPIRDFYEYSSVRWLRNLGCAFVVVTIPILYEEQRNTTYDWQELRNIMEVVIVGMVEEILRRQNLFFVDNFAGILNGELGKFVKIQTFLKIVNRGIWLVERVIVILSSSETQFEIFIRPKLSSHWSHWHWGFFVSLSSSIIIIGGRPMYKMRNYWWKIGFVPSRFPRR